MWKNLFLVSSDVPTTEELELLKDARERVGLVIRARWIILGMLALYGLAILVFGSTPPPTWPGSLLSTESLRSSPSPRSPRLTHGTNTATPG
jgi:uncharacterized protein involved in exopolysaccharide biosynthesis